MILRFLNRDATTRSMVDLSAEPVNIQSNIHLNGTASCHMFGSFINKDLLHDDIAGVSKSISRPASRLSRHGSEKRTKIGL